MNLVNYKLHFNIFQVFIFFLLAACRSTEPVGGQNQLDHPVVPGVLSTSPPSPSSTVTILPSNTPTTLPSPTPTVEATPSASPTPDPWTGLSIDSLTARTYGGGNIEIVETLAANSYFTRTLITYPSDGLDIYGFMNTPVVGEPPYPVVIALHGYINPEIYHTIDYTTRYADALAREGYLVIHPNLRGYPPSDEGDNLFRVGMAIDTLNLISLIKQQAGKPGPLSMADPDKIGIWGHSMGGGISTRVITISSDVRAAVLYGAMSGDEQQNFERIYDYFSNGERGMEELSFPEEAFERISPINYLERVQAAVSIHHGENDVDVPLPWSLDLCRRLRDLEKTVECYTYEDQPHTFHGEGDNLFIMQMVNFYNRILRGD
jgi:dipeptidyl aminopeptidase/acylaminoacyl peptidase